MPTRSAVRLSSISRAKFEPLRQEGCALTPARPRAADHDKQAAIDLFLGIKHALPPPPSWEYLPPPPRPSYRDWYTPSHLAASPASLSSLDVAQRLQATVDAEDARDPNELWRRYYRGGVWQTLDRQYQFHIQSTLPPHRAPGCVLAFAPPAASSGATDPSGVRMQV